MKKRILALLMAAVMVLGLAACSSSDSSSTTASSTDEGEAAEASVRDAASYKSDKDKSEWTIGVVTKDPTSDWFIRMGDGFDRFAEDTGINIIVKGPATADAASQLEVVDAFIDQGVDALCVVPIDPGALEASLQKALDKGIVVVTHEGSTCENTLYDVEAFTAEQYGNAIMDTLAEAMGEEGTYALMVAYTTTATHMEYTEAEYNRQLELYPDMQLLDDTWPNAEYEESISVAYDRAKELLKSNPDLKGFAGVVNEGVAKAIEELGVDAVMVGVGTPNQFAPYIETGSCVAVVLWDPMCAGYAMCQVAANILAGNDIAEGMDLGIDGYESVSIVESDVNTQILGDASIIVTKENVNDYDF